MNQERIFIEELSTFDFLFPQEHVVFVSLALPHNKTTLHFLNVKILAIISIRSYAEMNTFIFNLSLFMNGDRKTLWNMFFSYDLSGSENFIWVPPLRQWRVRHWRSGEFSQASSMCALHTCVILVWAPQGAATVEQCKAKALIEVLDLRKAQPQRPEKKMSMQSGY